MSDALPEYILNVIAKGDHLVLLVSNAKVRHKFPLSADQAVKLANALKRKAVCYEHVIYESGYYIAENGDILMLDGSPVQPERHISAEHLRMAAERKAKFQQG